MDVTEPLLESVSKALQLKGETRASMARAIGKSKPWMSKLFSGQVKQLPDDTVKKIEEFLEIELTPIIYLEETLSPLTLRIADALETNPGLASVFREVVDLSERRNFDDVTLEKIGDQIIKICDGTNSALEIGRKVTNLIYNHAKLDK